MANAMQCVGSSTGMRCPSHAGVFLGWVSLPFPFFTRCVNCEFPLHTTGLKTRGYSPSASRLSDAIYLMRLFSHGFKNPRLFAFGLASSRRLFLATRLSKPSKRRGLSSPWNKEVSIIKAVWKTGNLNSRWAFKPPDWIRTLHTMASGRREVK